MHKITLGIGIKKIFHSLGSSGHLYTLVNCKSNVCVAWENRDNGTGRRLRTRQFIAYRSRRINALNGKIYFRVESTYC